MICSPASAKSAYVTEEIRLFKARHPDRPVIPLIVDGKPGDPDLECFPPSLRFKLDDDGQLTGEPVELLAADAREQGDGKNLALAKVVAGLLGLSSDDIFRRAERDRRRRQRSWIAGLSAVAIMLAGLAVWAEINRREAVAQREVAERNFAIAKQGANSLIFDIAQALRHQEGMQTETVRKILGTAEEVIEKLADRSGGNPDLLRLQSAMFNEFATTYAAQGDTAKQDESARKALAIIARLAEEDANNAEWQRDLSVSYDRVGNALEAQGDRVGALQAYQNSLAIRGRLAEADPSNAARHDLSASYNNVGELLVTQGFLAEALEAHQVNLGIRQRLVEADPSNAAWRYDLGISNERIGDVLKAQGDLAAAMDAYEAKRKIIAKLVESDPGNARWQRDLAIAYDKVASVLWRRATSPRH